MNENNKPSFTLRGHTISAPSLEAGLYLVATPIGNLGDMTIRGLETLAGSTVVACEDTRTSGVLLKKFGIDRPKTSYNEHNADTRGPDLIRQMAQGAAVALISDAGTPLVSDPGFRLVKETLVENIPVVPLPGASAPLAALVASGLNNTEFRFCGFLPNKAQARLNHLKQFTDEKATLLFFESPSRLLASLKSFVEAFGEQRHAVVARELTKMHETFHRGTLEELVDEFSAMDSIRGEIVIVLEGRPHEDSANIDPIPLLTEALKTMKTKQASIVVAQETGLPKQELYRLALSLKDPSDNN